MARYHAIINMLPRGLSAEEATDYVGGPTMMKELAVKPMLQRKGLTLYDRLDLDRAIEALKIANTKAAEKAA